MSIGERFRAVREALQEKNSKKLTQQAMGETLGISRDSLANIENDRNPPTNPVIQLMVEKHNVNETWLRTGEGEMFNAIPEDAELQFLFGSFLTRLTSDGDSDEMLQAKAALIEEILRLTPEQVKGVVDFGARLAADLNKTKKEEQP